LRAQELESLLSISEDKHTSLLHEISVLRATVEQCRIAEEHKNNEIVALQQQTHDVNEIERRYRDELRIEIERYNKQSRHIEANRATT